MKDESKGQGAKATTARAPEATRTDVYTNTLHHSRKAIGVGVSDDR